MTAVALRPVDLLRRGLVAGLVGGLVAGVVAKLTGEHWVDRAIAYEEAHAVASSGLGDGSAGPAVMDEPLVSRAWQNTAGLFTATTLTGVALGGVLALALAVGLGRVRRDDGRPLAPRPLALLIAAVGFVAVTAVPALLYPAQPPGVGDPDTLGRRTRAYLLAIALSLAIAVFAMLLLRAQRRRLGTANAALLAVVTYVVGVGAAYALLPVFAETPPDFPAEVLWHFRLSSLAVDATLWVVVAIGLGWSTERALRTLRALPAQPAQHTPDERTATPKG